MLIVTLFHLLPLSCSPPTHSPPQSPLYNFVSILFNLGVWSIGLSSVQYRLLSATSLITFICHSGYYYRFKREWSQNKDCYKPLTVARNSQETRKKLARNSEYSKSDDLKELSVQAYILSLLCKYLSSSPFRGVIHPSQICCHLTPKDPLILWSVTETSKNF